MAKGVSETQHLSPDARDWLDNQLMRAERHVTARAALLAAQGNDDVVLPSHIESAWNEILGRRSYKKQFGIAITASAIIGGGITQSFLGGVGKAVGAYILHFFGK